MKIKRFFLWVAVLIAAAMTGLLLLWADANRVQAAPTQPRITAAIVTDTDKMIWDAIGINPGDDMYPDVAYNSQDDEYLVVFEWPDDSGRDIASILVDSNGQAAYSTNGVAITATYTDTHPAIAYNPTNNTYLAVWERRGASGDKAIWGALLNASGSVSGNEFYITYWSGDKLYPDVAYSAIYDRYLVVWEDHWLDWTNRPDIYGVLVDGLGSILALDYESITGLNAPDSQTRPAVAANASNGRWLVAWVDSRNSGTTGYDIYTQQVYSNGTTMLWGVQTHIGDFWGAAGPPDVAWGGDEFLTVWPENDLIYGQRVQADSSLAGDVISVSTNYISSKFDPAVAFDSTDGAWWVAWEDSRDHRGPG